MAKSCTVQQFAVNPDGDPLQEHELERFERLAQELKSRLQKNRRAVWEIGKRLLEVKQLLAHGQFGAFHQDFLGISRSTASRYMNVARKWKLPSNIPDEVTFREIYEEASKLAQARSAHANRREGGGCRRQGRKYDPNVTLTMLVRLKKRFRQMRMHPDWSIPPEPDARASVIKAMWDVRNQVERFLEELGAPEPPKEPEVPIEQIEAVFDRNPSPQGTADDGTPKDAEPDDANEADLDDVDGVLDGFDAMELDIDDDEEEAAVVQSSQP